MTQMNFSEIQAGNISQVTYWGRWLHRKVLVKIPLLMLVNTSTGIFKGFPPDVGTKVGRILPNLIRAYTDMIKVRAVSSVRPPGIQPTHISHRSSTNELSGSYFPVQLSVIVATKWNQRTLPGHLSQDDDSMLSASRSWDISPLAYRRSVFDFASRCVMCVLLALNNRRIILWDRHPSLSFAKERNKGWLI